ncbi:small integral membrane protein 32 [Chanos chanos]|uniref:Small integral membrane protein 32 n=1 Tax=Chanos chanos TaxID=29144 RepID=A0A6J2USH4_CHACN|nr:small integral membrane protein 32 [Chanos chanos]
MLRQMLLNSTAAGARGFHLMTQTHAPPTTLEVSQGPSLSVSALLKPTGRGGGSGGLREGELSKPDLATYVVMCLVLFLLVLLIVFFINCQLRNSFFASMPYDRSLREARSSYK